MNISKTKSELYIVCVSCGICDI